MFIDGIKKAEHSLVLNVWFLTMKARWWDLLIAVRVPTVNLVAVDKNDCPHAEPMNIWDTKD